MYIAIDNNQRVRPSKDLRKAICQCCGSSVIAKTGDKKVWHWAHEFLGDCTQKGKGEWHYFWQDQLDITEVEVRDPKWPNNIADICIRDPRLPDGYLVVELQESAISLEDVVARNKAYKNILWVTNQLNKSNVQKSLYELPIIKHTTTNIIRQNGSEYDISNVDIKELFICLFINTMSTPVTSERDYSIHLKVPFKDKDEAKRLGAKWDPVEKTWYADLYDSKFPPVVFDKKGWIPNDHWIHNSEFLHLNDIAYFSNIFFLSLMTIPEVSPKSGLYTATCVYGEHRAEYVGQVRWKRKPTTEKMLKHPDEFLTETGDIFHKKDGDLFMCSKFNVSQAYANSQAFLSNIRIAKYKTIRVSKTATVVQYTKQREW